jgi:hypothetical protein
MKSETIATIALCVSIVALCVTIINACTGIANVVLSRRCLVRVRLKNREFGGSLPYGNRLMTVDVTSFGAAIHDIEAYLHIDATGAVVKDGPSIIPKSEFFLNPAFNVPSPLNPGQSQMYDLSLRDFDNEERGDDLRRAINNVLPQLKPKAVSIRIYCDGKRTLLRQLSSRKLKGDIDKFFAPHVAVDLQLSPSHGG